MRILPISNNLLRGKTHAISKYNLPSYKTQSFDDNFSFQSKYIYLKGEVKNINSNEFPDNLYLDLDNIYKNFENQKPYRRWESLRFNLASLFAKRCNYLGVTKNAKGGLVGFEKDKAVITVSDSTKGKNPKNIDFDWTEQYKELEEFFEGDDFYPAGASRDLYEIKAGLPKILEKQGWIKPY